MNAPQTHADPEHRFGAILYLPSGEVEAYFETAAEAIAYAQGCWSMMTEDQRSECDVVAAEIKLHVRRSGLTIYDEFVQIFDAKEVQA